MRFIRYRDKQTKQPAFGWVLEEKVGRLEGSPFSEYRRLEPEWDLDQVELLAPVLPTKVVCVGRNYASHAREHNVDVPDLPLLFLKPPSAVIGPQKPIYIPPQASRVEHEAEMAVIIGKSGRWIPAEKANNHILGYTIANDVTARQLQRSDGQWTRGKGFDTFCPLGPWIETSLDPADTLITCRVNDEMRQMASTREMIYTIPQLIAFASSFMTLCPGDVLLTGTPAGVGPLREGDLVEIDIEGIGVLRNPVELEPERNT
ncbi:MAG: fumarylacetoacetate hydrolase family protein [Anaerolineaceae bacterium]|nr:fumarylacetoacetate hydrolase family protein [Anaerolineaceae bacterium]